MPAPTGKDYVTRGHPKVGRARLDDGSFVSLADVQFTRSLLDPTSIVARKQGYFVQDLREGVPEGNEYFYRLKAPAKKHLVIFNRDISANEGPIRFETLVGGTPGGTGTPLTPTPLFVGGPAPEAEISGGATPTGGQLIPADFLFGSQFFFFSQPTASSTGLPTIIPPGAEVFVKLSYEGTGTNAGIRFALAFAELVIPDILVIS